MYKNLYAPYFSLNIISVTNPGKLCGWTCGMHGRNAYNILVQQSEGNRSLVRLCVQTG